MKAPALLLLLLCFGCSGFQTHDVQAGSNRDREALARTSQAIRDGFARGDVATILAYHHPDVVKALSYGKIITGREALRADLVGTLREVSLRWKENRVESLLIHGDTAVEQTAFTIEGTPKNGGPPFQLKGGPR